MPLARALASHRFPRFPLLLPSLLLACASPERAPEAPAPDAVDAFAGARALRDEGAQAADPELWQLLRRARALAPDWLPPMRLEDDLFRAEHLEIEALERRRIQRAEEPQSAAAHYLVARLEADLDPRRFESVVRLDPDLAWGRYGLALCRSLQGPITARLEADWRRSMRQASTPWESAYFALGLARLLDREGREEDAVELLEEVLYGLGLRGADRAWILAELARLELSGSSFERRRRGYERALELLRTESLGERRLVRLVSVVEGAYSVDDPSGMQLELALSSRDTPARRRLAASRALRRGELGQAEAELAGAEPERWRALLEEIESRGWLFRQERFIEALERWLASLPLQVLDPGGLPANPGLREVLDLGRRHARTSSSADLLALGEALVRAGWYAEALAVSRTLLEADVAGARSLRRRALAGRALFLGLSVSLHDVEEGDPAPLARAQDQGGRESSEIVIVGSLDDLLSRWGSSFALCTAQQGGGTTAGVEGLALGASPRLGYGPFAELVHPGPSYSVGDEEEGLGQAGDAVGGLAASMAAHGRFAIVGTALGAAPDASVLRRLLVEERAGEHLGTTWRGTIAWCEGTDVDSRAQRAGAYIGGAALHEGYWIDIAVVRKLRGRWLELALEYDAPGLDPEREAARLAAVLSTPGLRLRTPASRPRRRARERTAIKPVLGQASRVRLAVLADRAAPGDLLGEVSLSELVEQVAIHEEGHLCDRTRFLPLSSRWPYALVFLLEQTFSADAVQERLEYRAQLVALACIDDPRLALIDLLEAAEARTESGLEHGPAYRKLLADFLEELDKEVQRDPLAWPRLSDEHTLLHQLHRLDGEEVRGVALTLATREGLAQ